MLRSMITIQRQCCLKYRQLAQTPDSAYHYLERIPGPSLDVIHPTDKSRTAFQVNQVKLVIGSHTRFRCVSQGTEGSLALCDCLFDCHLEGQDLVVKISDFRLQSAAPFPRDNFHYNTTKSLMKLLWPVYYQKVLPLSAEVL